MHGHIPRAHKVAFEFAELHTDIKCHNNTEYEHKDVPHITAARIATPRTAATALAAMPGWTCVTIMEDVNMFIIIFFHCFHHII